MPFAVFERPITGTFALSAVGSAAKACCESVGPTIPTTLSLEIRDWYALIAPCSSPPVSWSTTLIGRPLTPPRSLKNFSARRPPFFSSSPRSATLLVVAIARPIGIGCPVSATGAPLPDAALAAGAVALPLCAAALPAAAVAAGALVAAGADVAREDDDEPHAVRTNARMTRNGT